MKKSVSKWIALLLSVVMIVMCAAGCSKTQTQETATDDTTDAPAQTADTPAQADEPEQADAPEQAEPVDERGGNKLSGGRKRHKRARADMQRAPAGRRDDGNTHHADEIHIPRRACKPQCLPLCQQIRKQQNERDRVHKKADAEQAEIIAHLTVERNHDAL